MAYLCESSKITSMDDPNSTDFIMEPADMTIDLEQGAFKDAVVTGSTSQSEYKSLQDSRKPILEEEKPLVRQYEEAGKAYSKAMQKILLAHLRGNRAGYQRAHPLLLHLIAV